MSYLAYAHMFEPEKEATTIWKQPKVAGSIKVASVLIDKGYEYLSISGLGNNGCVELANMIRDKPRGLKKIQIDNNNIGDKGGVALFEVLADNKTIESLEMGENSIGAQTMKQALDTLRTNKTLVYLDLGQNRGLHSSGVMLLSAGLKRNSTLQSLCLNRCGIPPKGLIALAEGLESNNGVTFLNINANQMASSVGVAFANMLKKNKTLQKLSMGGGSKQLGDKGFIPIAEALDTNTSLSYLNVQKNNIKDQGALRFGITLTKNSTLQRIDLSRNSFTSKGMHSFIEGMKVNKTLFSLFVDDFTSSQGSELYELVKLNETTNNLQEMDIFLNILKDGNQRGPLMRSKLMVIGQGMSGKTATVRSLLGEPFEEKWKSTIGANVRESKVTSKQGWVGIHKSQKFEYTKDFVANLAVKQIDRKNASEVHLSKGMEDVEEKKFMVGENMKGEQEITALEKKDGLEDDDDDEVEKSEIAAKIHRIKSSASSKAALANVHDEVGMSAPMSGYKEVARKFKEDLLTTAKTERDALKFSIWDYGGQRVFYSLHHLFLTKFGIYMLIFDMRQMLKNPGLCRVYLQFWLHSLSLHAPETPLMLVGTYLDEVSAQEDMVTINQRVASNLENFPFNVIQNEHDRLLFFPISNKQGLGISSVRVFLDRTARQQKYVHMQVPLTWIYTLEALMKEHLEWVSLTEFKQYASKNRVHDGKEIKAMLELFHELGLMLHLTQTSSLKEVVTLNPQWLITSIGRIIRDNKLHAHNMEKLEKNGLGEDVKTLFADGLASDSLCRFLWNDSQVDYLLDLMRQTLLICDWNFNRGETDEHKNKNYYLVPSVITGSKDLEEYDDDEEAGKDFKDGGAAQVKHDKEVKNKVYENKNLRNICAFEFGFLPDGVYDRLVCLCVAHSNLIKASKAPLITSTHCEITFDNNAVIQLYEKKEIETIYMELRNNPETLNQASNCLVIVQSMLKKLRSDIIGLGLTWEVFFPQSDRTLMSQDKASDLNLAPWFSKLTRAEYIKKTTNVDHIDVASFLGRFQDM